MTATLAPPPAAPPPPPEPTPRPRPSRREPHWPTGPWVTELLLLAVTLVAVAGYARLFADRATVVPLL
ncbi:MAG TPA: hypothetical protein VK507_00205, partial [Iamia sp.]|nr:hypothetical protein [Iamia sp.]